ncbi:MAG: ABC transporter ATP-binding protein, partial [Leptospiraceae bacterium]|nr:ABC transporter ATP-binding protein [Leptospiraceae bacterium]
IGPNGAGKSTLLRILTGISAATSGSVRYTGAVRAILELGVGFNADLTGRENIYYNGRLWGYTGRELLANTDSILDFARLREYADFALNTYSTGMQMRLAFALATHRRSDLLLIDEALAVGDASFQQRCIRRFQEFRAAGSLIVVVSHDLHMLRAVADRILVLDSGRNEYFGEPVAAVQKYMQLIAEQSRRQAQNVRQLQPGEWEFALLDAHLQPARLFIAGDTVRVQVRLHPEEARADQPFTSEASGRVHAAEPAASSLNAHADHSRTHESPAAELAQITVGIHVSDGRGIRAFGVNTRQLGRHNLTAPVGQLTCIEFQLRINLGPGKYNMGFSVHRGLAHAQDCYLWEEGLIEFEVEAPADRQFEGMSYLEPEVRLIAQ